LIFLEFIADLLSQNTGNPPAKYVGVAPSMLADEMDSIRRGFAKAFPSRQALTAICQHAEINPRVVLEAWKDRLELLKSHKRDVWRPWFDQDLSFLQLP